MGGVWKILVDYLYPQSGYHKYPRKYNAKLTEILKCVLLEMEY